MQHHFQLSAPLVVQRDGTILAEAHHPDYPKVREQLKAFAELVKAPEKIHTYRLTPLSIWNAVACGWSAEQMIALLAGQTKFPLVNHVKSLISESAAKYGLLIIESLKDNKFVLVSECKDTLAHFIELPSLKNMFTSELYLNENKLWTVELEQSQRGRLKREALRQGFPIIDKLEFKPGEKLNLKLRETLGNNEFFQFRGYQAEAIESFCRTSQHQGGAGVIVLPCGSGKTIVGLGCMAELQEETLILTTSVTAVKQWRDELLHKTTLTDEQIGLYSSESKEIKPVTIATYNILTYKNDEDAYIHLNLFHAKNWGLIIYDEVHQLPAPIFRATAEIQSARRLGLTATLVREDGHEQDVFSLVGPKLYEASWKELEQDAYIAKATCTEIRVPFDPYLEKEYYQAPLKHKLRISQENPVKLKAIERLLKQHEGDSILIIGQYIHQLEEIANLLQVPLITGQTSQQARDELYARFKAGEIKVLAVSKVANFAINLPDATVAVQVSGTFGSRQEEAQRLGRILRPKLEKNQAYFYHIVTKGTLDEEYAQKRQRFLIEQGYRYQVLELEEG